MSTTLTENPVLDQDTDTDQKSKRQPPYHVILWDSPEHSWQYVIAMLQIIFGYPPEKGFKMAEEVDKKGKCVVFTTHLELAELKRDQIHSVGKDPSMASCKGSMTATLEPAE